MWTLIRNGGFPMVIILAFGVTALVAAARFAMAPRLVRPGFIEKMAAATLWSTLAGLAADLAAVFINLSSNEALTKDPAWHLLLVTGLGESMSPLIVGFAFLALTALLVAVGRSREAPPAV